MDYENTFRGSGAYARVKAPWLVDMKLRAERATLQDMREARFTKGFSARAANPLTSSEFLANLPLPLRKVRDGVRQLLGKA